MNYPLTFKLEKTNIYTAVNDLEALREDIWELSENT